MTLQASGQITLKDIFEELYGVPHTTQQEGIKNLYDYSTLTPKTTNIAFSDFYGYMQHSFGGWSPTFENVAKPASSFNKDVLAQGYGWTIQSKPSWVSSLNPSSVADAAELLDVSVTVNYDANSGASRSGDVVLIQNTTSLTTTLTINQDGDSIEIDPTFDTVSYEFGTYQDLTELIASDDWSVTSSPSWVISVSPSSGTATAGQMIDIRVEENTTGSPRNGDVVFKLDDFSIEVTFSLSQMANPV